MGTSFATPGASKLSWLALCATRTARSNLGTHEPLSLRYLSFATVAAEIRRDHCSGDDHRTVRPAKRPREVLGSRSEAQGTRNGSSRLQIMTLTLRRP